MVWLIGSIYTIPKEVVDHFDLFNEKPSHNGYLAAQAELQG